VVLHVLRKREAQATDAPDAVAHGPVLPPMYAVDTLSMSGAPKIVRFVMNGSRAGS
jgi:hypothetical protein